MKELEDIDAKIERLKRTILREADKRNNNDEKSGETQTISLVKEKKKLSKEEFFSEEFMKGYVEYEDPSDIQVGDFVRYERIENNGKRTYLWGGLVIFKNPVYLRLKNVYMKNGKAWSVQLADPKVRNVFYVRSKMSIDDQELFVSLSDDNFINLNKTSSESLLEEVARRGDERLIVEWARAITQINTRTYVFD
jgi:hypothetical protein